MCDLTRKRKNCFNICIVKTSNYCNYVLVLNFGTHSKYTPIFITEGLSEQIVLDQGTDIGLDLFISVIFN